MRLPIALLAVLLVHAAACAQDAGKLPIDGGRGTGVGGHPGDAALPCTNNPAVGLNAKDVDLLIVLDTSESMGIGFGPGTRYSVLANLLSNLVDVYQSRIRFGLAQFPGPDALCLDQTLAGCCAGPPLVEVAPGDGAAMQGVLNSTPLLAGNTPTASALGRALEYYSGLSDGVADRYVLLATDGLPSCTLSGQLSSNPPANADGGFPNACQDAVAQVQALWSQGINVLVLSVGAELTDDPAGPPDCLDQMAQAGGMPKAPPGPGYYSAASSESLETTIENIFGGLARSSCQFALGSAPTSPAEVSVELDGQKMPRDQNHEDGWDFDPPGVMVSIRIFGQYCDRIQHFQYSAIAVSYSCPPQCAGEIGCQ